MGAKQPGVNLTPEQAVASMLAAGAQPLEPYVNTHRPWLCRCLSCGGEITPRLAKVRAGQSPCRACAVRRYANFRRQSHELAARDCMMSAGLQPIDPYPGALAPWRCECQRCGREVFSRYANVFQGHDGCAFCAGKAVDQEDAYSLMKAAGVIPLVAYPGSSIGWKSTCVTCSREVSPAYGSIRSGQSACKYCARRAVDPSEAEAAMRDSGLEPLVPYPGGNTPWSCRCTRCGEVASPRYSHIRRLTYGCARCAGNEAISAEVAEEDFRRVGYTPLEPFPGGVESPWRAVCGKCKRESTPTLKAVRKGARCVYCAKVRVSPAEADDLMRQHDLEPLETYPGSHTPWRCLCRRCGREVKARYHHVSSRGSSCRYCSERGPDMTAPSTVYLLAHYEKHSYKIGVSRRNSTRLKQHTSRGWSILRVWQLPTGEDAYRVEAKVLSWIRQSVGLPPFLAAEDLPQGGWTETFDLDSISAVAVIERVRIEIANSLAEDRP